MFEGNDARHPLVRDNVRQGGYVAATASGLRLVRTGDVPDLPRQTRARRLQFVLKRAMDLIVATCALVTFSPLLICVAVLIKMTSTGPVIIRQERYGRDGRIFDVYKFRTMYFDRGDPAGVEQAVPNDPRVTPVGRYIRRSSIDELPQLINILKGEMSLVGPRPHPVGMRAAGVLYEDLVPYYHLRHAVVPGLSGWAQVNGLRGPTVDPVLARSRVDHDLAYIQNFSLWLDFKIILLTLRYEFLAGSGD